MKPITATSAVEFLIWLLIAASAIAILAKRLRAPYTVALVAGGLMLSALRLPRLSPLDPGQRPDWLTPDVILIVFLPALVFEGGVKLNVRDLLRIGAPPTSCKFGCSARRSGYRLPGALDNGPAGTDCVAFWGDHSATDPISVLAIFKDLRMDKRLSLIVEGESLLNDGTAAALFQIVLAGIISGHVGVSKGTGQFLFAVSEEWLSAPSSATRRADSRERLMTPKCKSPSPLLLPTAAISLPINCTCQGSSRLPRRALLSAISVREIAARRPKPR